MIHGRRGEIARAIPQKNAVLIVVRKLFMCKAYIGTCGTYSVNTRTLSLVIEDQTHTVNDLSIADPARKMGLQNRDLCEA